jgi:hypothetical protein
MHDLTARLHRVEELDAELSRSIAAAREQRRVSAMRMTSLDAADRTIGRTRDDSSCARSRDYRDELPGNANAT